MGRAGWITGALLTAPLAGCVADLPAGARPDSALAARLDAASDRGAPKDGAAPDARPRDEDAGDAGAAGGAGGGLDGGERPDLGAIFEVGVLPEFDADPEPTGPLDGALPDAVLLDLAPADALIDAGLDAEPTDPVADQPLPREDGEPLRWLQLAAGHDLSCALRNDGRARCWGDLGRNLERAAPVDRYFQQLDVTDRKACGLTHPGGAIVCWGGMLPPLPPRFAEGGYSAVRLGTATICGLFERALDCVGDAARLPPPLVAPTEGGPNFDQLALGEGGCALDLQGGLLCFGDAALASLPPGRFSGVAVGKSHACAVPAPEGIEGEPAASPMCWGEGAPEVLDPPPGIWARIDAERDRTCGLNAAGIARCWGANPPEVNVPFGDGGLRQVAAGRTHACALTEAGVALCWGPDPNHPAVLAPQPASF